MLNGKSAYLLDTVEGRHDYKSWWRYTGGKFKEGFTVGWSGIEKFTEAFFDFFMRWLSCDGWVKAYALRGQVGVTFKRFMPKLAKLPRQQNL